MHPQNWDDRFTTKEKDDKRRTFSPPLSQTEGPVVRSASAFWSDYENGGRALSPKTDTKIGTAPAFFIDKEGWKVRADSPCKLVQVPRAFSASPEDYKREERSEVKSPLRKTA